MRAGTHGAAMVVPPAALPGILAGVLNVVLAGLILYLRRDALALSRDEASRLEGHVTGRKVK